jgi:uncharacterized damage-inducible protein DinB
MSAEHLVTLAKYNHWANEKICAFINEAGEIIADTELTSSFPTIRKTSVGCTSDLDEAIKR